MAKSQLFKRPMSGSPRTAAFPRAARRRDEEMMITAERDPRPRRRDHDVLRGRPLADRPSRGTGEAGHRPPRTRDRGAGRADSDLRLLAHPQLEAAAVPEGDGPVRRGDALGGVENPTREQQQAVADQVLVEIRGSTGTRRAGRKGVLRSMREQRRAERGAPRAQRSPRDHGCYTLPVRRTRAHGRIAPARTLLAAARSARRARARRHRSGKRRPRCQQNSSLRRTARSRCAKASQVLDTYDVGRACCRCRAPRSPAQNPGDRAEIIPRWASTAAAYDAGAAPRCPPSRLQRKLGKAGPTSRRRACGPQ